VNIYKYTEIKSIDLLNVRNINQYRYIYASSSVIKNHASAKFVLFIFRTVNEIHCLFDPRIDRLSQSIATSYPIVRKKSRDSIF